MKTLCAAAAINLERLTGTEMSMLQSVHGFARVVLGSFCARSPKYSIARLAVNLIFLENPCQRSTRTNGRVRRRFAFVCIRSLRCQARLSAGTESGSVER